MQPVYSNHQFEFACWFSESSIPKSDHCMISVCFVKPHIPYLTNQIFFAPPLASPHIFCCLRMKKAMWQGKSMLKLFEFSYYYFYLILYSFRTCSYQSQFTAIEFPN